MYLRFVSPLRSETYGGYVGIFQAAFDCFYSDAHPAFLRNAIDDELDYFREYLDAPDEHEFEVCARRQRVALGICWFRGEAADMISHAFSLRTLLAECGIYITTIRTRHPGIILYEDRHQIVARPRASTPTAWG